MRNAGRWLATLSALWCAAGAAAQEVAQVGKPAPEWNITDGQNIVKTARLADYRGKWVVLEVWGFW